MQILGEQLMKMKGTLEETERRIPMQNGGI